MITLNFSVDDQLLTRTDENTVAANSHLVHTCEFVFSSEWDGRGKVATFKKRDLMLSVILDDDACTIPPEILQSENKIDVFELSVCGADGNSTITSTVVKVPILAGTWDVMSTEITPTMFEQIMQKIEEIEEGQIDPESIEAAIEEYFRENPDAVINSHEVYNAIIRSGLANLIPKYTYYTDGLEKTDAAAGVSYYVITPGHIGGYDTSDFGAIMVNVNGAAADSIYMIDGHTTLTPGKYQLAQAWSISDGISIVYSYIKDGTEIILAEVNSTNERVAFVLPEEVETEGYVTKLYIRVSQGTQYGSEILPILTYGDVTELSHIPHRYVMNNEELTEETELLKTAATNLSGSVNNLNGRVTELEEHGTGTTPVISATATVDNTTGTPAVNVTKTGTDAAPKFTFAFTGLKGTNGTNGVNGTPGKSAYQIAVDNGFVGSEQEWLDSLSANASEEVIVDYTDTNYAGINSWPATAITMTATPSNAIFNYTDFTDTQNASQRVFGIASFNVKELLGHGYKIKYSVSNPDYTDESQSYAINSVVLAAAQFSWGANAVWLHALASEVDQNGENEIDLDAFYSANKATIDSWADVWLLIGQNYKFEAVNGVITGFPATTITVSAKYAIEAEKTAQKSIVCWGDSLTALGGWTTKLAELSGLSVYNGGTGGEDARTIMSRQGGDIMTTNDITIPATVTPVNVGYHQGGTVKTELGYYSVPLRGGGSEHVNPVKIGNVEGTLAWTGSNITDPNGTLTFTRTEAGQTVIIDRPTAIRTAFDRYHNGADNIMIIFMGQNGWGSDDVNDLINMHKLMIEHFAGKEFVVLGLSSGSAASRADYEAAMKTAFGRRFISLREYLAHPIYENGQIVSCYGLADQGLAPGSKEYNGVTYVALDEIAQGIVPHQILIDNVHYTEGTKTVIGNMLYKKMQELNILA